MAKKEVVYDSQGKDGKVWFRVPNAAKGAKEAMVFAPKDLMNDTFGTLGSTLPEVQNNIFEVDVDGEKIKKFFKK